MTFFLNNTIQNKRDVIQVSGHELLTPLTIIIEGILDGIGSGIDRLHQIVNSMLDVARIDSDSLRVHREAVMLATVVKQVAARFKHDLKQRRLSLCSNP
jgi:signal transduction histidine kinase